MSAEAPHKPSLSILPLLESTYVRVLGAVLFVLIGCLLLFVYFANSFSGTTHEMRRTEIQRIVEIAMNTLQPIRARQQAGEISVEEAIAEAADVLRHMTFRDENGQNTVFMGTYDGDLLVQPFDTPSEAVNWWDFQNERGEYVIRELVSTARQGEGFVDYHFPPPGSTALEPKLSYVVGVPEWQVFIGTGMYFTAIDARNQAYIRDSLVLALLMDALIFAIIFVAFRPTLRGYNVLLRLFEHVINQPDDTPDVPVESFRQGSEGWKLMSGFRKMLAQVRQSKHQLRESAVALAEREEQYRSIFESTTDALIIYDMEAMIVEANPAACRLYGYSYDEFVGMSSSAIIDPAYFDNLDEFLERLRSGGHFSAQAINRHRDGSEIHVEVHGTYFTYKGQRHLLAVVRNITEQVQAIQLLEQRVEERTRELSELLETSREVAIENARLYVESSQRADEIQTLFTVQQAIISPLDPDAVLQLIADEARRLTSTRVSAVYLLEGDRLRLSVLSGDYGEHLHVGLEFPAEGTISNLAMQAGKPILIADALNDPRVDTDVARQRGVKCYMVVPLISGTQPIGTISVIDKMIGPFGADDERVLALLAPGAVIGLENARLYQEEQARRQEADKRRKIAEGLRDILTIINSNRSLTEILDYIVAQASRLLESNAAAIFRVEGAHTAVIEAVTGLPYDFSIVGMEILTDDDALERMKERRPIMESDISLDVPDLSTIDDPQRREVIEHMLTHYRSAMGMPLMVNDEIYGGLVLYYTTRREFSDEDAALLAAFGDQAALAIENARLRKQSEESAAAAERSRLARDLHDAVTQMLFSATLIAEVLPRLWKDNPPEGEKRLQDLRRLTKGALAEMRTLLLELRPTGLTEVPLGDLMRHLVEAVSGRTNMNIHLAVEGQSTLPGETQVMLYRIAQEALNNIIKHSRATTVEVGLCYGAEAVELCVNDNGQGFDLQAIPAGHMGLKIMHERAASIGAELHVESQPGQGTRIQIFWSKTRVIQ
jgi:PAS domain S-box-containing protein